MYFLSQDKNRIYNMSGHIEGISYEPDILRKGKKEETRHTIQVFDGCSEEIAVYSEKEDCLFVINLVFDAIENRCNTFVMPSQDELKRIKEQKEKDIIPTDLLG